MSNSSHLIRAALSSPDLLRRSIRRRTYVGLLVAATSATVFLSGSAHSGPCAGQIARLEGQIRDAALSPQSGPTAPQSVAGLLHHQPTPDAVQNAERRAQLAGSLTGRKCDGKNDSLKVPSTYGHGGLIISSRKRFEGRETSGAALSLWR
jgi:hypothetical protein